MKLKMDVCKREDHIWGKLYFREPLSREPAPHIWGKGSQEIALALLVAISGPKQVLIIRAYPFQLPSQWMLPASKSLCPAPYKQQVY